MNFNVEGFINRGVHISFKPLNAYVVKVLINGGKGFQKSFSVIHEPLYENGREVWNCYSKDNEIIVTWRDNFVVRFKVLNFDEMHMELLQYIDRDDRIYGLGEKYARLNRRFKRFHIWNIDQPVHLPSGDPMYVSIPFYIVANSKRSVGVFYRLFWVYLY
jgi:alpha-glucosidase